MRWNRMLESDAWNRLRSRPPVCNLENNKYLCPDYTIFLNRNETNRNRDRTRMEGKPKGGISRLAPHLSDVSPRHS